MAAGALFQGVLDALRRRWQAESERDRRKQERAEEAASDLLIQLDKIYEAFVAIRDPLGEPEDMDGALARLRRKSALLTDTEVRRRLDLIYEALGHTSSIGSFHGDRPRQVAMKVCHIGHETLGAFLRTEELPKDVSILDEYHSAVVEDHEAHEESRRRHLEEIRRKHVDGESA